MPFQRSILAKPSKDLFIQEDFCENIENIINIFGSVLNRLSECLINGERSLKNTFNTNYIDSLNTPLNYVRTMFTFISTDNHANIYVYHVINSTGPHNIKLEIHIIKHFRAFSILTFYINILSNILA